MRGPDGTTGTGGAGEPFWNADRGVSEVLSVVLLIGITLTGTVVLVVVGGVVLGDSKAVVEVSQAEHALTQFDARASQVALGEAPIQQVDLGLGDTDGAVRVQENDSWLRVELVDGSTGTRSEVENASLGSLVYERGDTTVAYQGGGVWRSDGEGSVMLSRPEFHQRGKTLTLPIINTTADGSVYSRVEVTKDGPGVDAFPNQSVGWTNKLEDSMVDVTVHSTYYEAWGRYFEENTDGIVGYDHGAETVTVRFLALPPEFSPRSGVIATSGPGEINMRATGAYIDSYNSSEGPYTVSQSTNGTVEAAGNVDMGGDAEIAGNVNSGRDIILGSSSNVIDGDANYTQELDAHGGATITGTTNQIGGVPPVPPIDGYVTERVEELRATNDNDNASVITGNELDLDGGAGELGAGAYYLETLDLEGEELVLDTTEGNVTIAVRDYVSLARSGGDGSTLSVAGDGDVRVYVAGQNEVVETTPGLGEQELNLFVGRGSAVYVPDQRSTQLTFFARSDFTATVAGSSSDDVHFTGVVYAPAGEHGPGWMHLRHGDLYGAVVTGNLTLDNQGQVHFDHALSEERLPLSPSVQRLEYLYVTTHEIRVGNTTMTPGGGS